jgi:hypothetical protein
VREHLETVNRGQWRAIAAYQMKHVFAPDEATARAQAQQ